MLDTLILTIFKAHTLSVWQCGILMMIDTPILAIWMRKKSLKMWTHLFVARALSEGQCGILTMIDTPNLAIFENVEMSLYRNVSTFLDFVLFLEGVETSLYILSSLVFHIVRQCGILTMIDTPILVYFWKCGNVSIYRSFHISWFCPLFENVETSLCRNVSTFLDFAFFST